MYSPTAKGVARVGNVSAGTRVSAAITGVQASALIGVVHGGATIFAHITGVQSSGLLGRLRVSAKTTPPPQDSITFLRVWPSGTSIDVKPSETFVLIEEQ